MKRTILALTLALSIPALSAHAAGESPTTDAPGSAKHAVATCRDGKTAYSASDEHRGKCSGHGGVASWADGSPVRSKGGAKDEYR